MKITKLLLTQLKFGQMFLLIAQGTAIEDGKTMLPTHKKTYIPSMKILFMFIVFPDVYHHVNTLSP